ncbi:hypothetical protein KKC32_01330 [Patescibacteria group bacterium]|nr:hypothetical protein [Patescibacteria group bacterium]
MKKQKLFYIFFGLILLAMFFPAGSLKAADPKKSLGHPCLLDSECQSSLCQESSLPEKYRFCGCSNNSDCDSIWGADIGMCSSNVEFNYKVNYCYKLAPYESSFSITDELIAQAKTEQESARLHMTLRKDIGQPCKDKSECLSEKCESSDISGVSFCVCDVEEDCVERYGAGSWTCTDGTPQSHNVNFCKKDGEPPIYPVTDEMIALGKTQKEPGVVESSAKEAPAKPTTLIPPSLAVAIPGLKPWTTTEVAAGETVSIPYLADYLIAVYNYGVGFAAIVAVLALMIGGILYLTAGPLPSNVAQAKKIMFGAVTGLVLLLGSYMILNIINPNLTKLKALQIETIAGKALDFPNPDITAFPQGIPGNCDSYDPLFQMYGSCLGTDWKILKAIASSETGCRNVTNDIGYTGMAQTKPENCVSAFKSSAYPQFTSMCTNAKLNDPQFAVAFMSVFHKPNVSVIKANCPDATPAEIGAAFYAFHNVPVPAKEFVVKGHCKDKSKFIEAFNNVYRNKRNLENTPPYMKKFGKILETEGKEAFMTAIGDYKISYAINVAGPKFARMGGNINEVPTGICPLGTSDPFPAYSRINPLVVSGNKILAIGDSITASSCSYAKEMGSTRIAVSSKKTAWMWDQIKEKDLTGFKYLTILGGVNDIASETSLATTKSNLTKIYQKAHESGLKVIAITMNPWRYKSWTEAKHQQTLELNDWIRAGGDGNIDKVVDFYNLVKDNNNPPEMRSEFWGNRAQWTLGKDIDHLHPNCDGHAILKEAVIRAIAELEPQT